LNVGTVCYYNPWDKGTQVQILGTERTPLPVSFGLVGQWSGEDNARDSKGLNNGSEIGIQRYETGKFGRAFSFSKDEGGVQVASNDTLEKLKAVTIVAWIKPIKPDGTGGNTDAGAILTKGNEGKRSFGFWLFPGNTLDIGYYDGGTRNIHADTSIAQEVAKGDFIHVVGVIDPATGRLEIWVNGQPKSCTYTIDTVTQQRPPSNLSLVANKDPITIGCWFQGSNLTPRFQGLLDEVLLYDRALSKKEVESLHDYRL
jgi:hypothetical protein